MENCKLIIAGFGGQGILFAGKVLAYAAMLKKKKLSWLPSYGPEMRGGTANCHVIVGDEPVASPIVTKPDALIVMNKPSLDKFEGSVREGGCIFVDESLIDRRVERNDIDAVYVRATETADALGAGGSANMIMLGALLAKTGLFAREELENALRRLTSPKKAQRAERNITALRAGCAAGAV